MHVVVVGALLVLAARSGANESTCALGERLVAVRVTPWADIVVDGKLAAAGAISVDLALAPGPHLLSFRNPGATQLDRAVEVLACGPTAPLVVNLERRPAQLTVRSNAGDAEVSVCGPSVLASTTERTPLAVSLPSNAASVEVRLSRAGRANVVRRVTLESGRKATVVVILDKD